VTANNASFTPTAGQAYLGAKVSSDPQIFAAKITAAGGLAAGGNVPTVAILGGAGTVGSITQQNGYDMAGNFILTAGTASINGGSLCSVTFGQPLAAAPVAVQVNAGYTAGTFSLGVGAVSVSKTGFVVQGAAPVSGAAYLISYTVIRSPL
jgi:hypothetical protein